MLDKDKIWYMWQYLSDIEFKNWETEFIFDMTDEDHELRKIKFRLWEIIINFNSLESEIDSYICELISDRSDELWMMIIYNMSYWQKISFLINYYLRLDKMCFREKYKDKINKINKWLRKIWEIRNWCVHAYWYTDNTVVKVKNKFNSDWVNFIYRKIDSKILDEYNKFINSVSKELNKLHLKIIENL